MNRNQMDRETAALHLPFAVNGTLPAPEAAQLEDWLAHDPDLQDDAAFLSRLRGLMRAEPLPETGAEFGLARLLRELPPQLAPAAAPARWRQVLSGMAVPALAACVAAVVAGLGTAALLRPEAPAEDLYYEQASGDTADLPRLTVTFAPDAKAGDLAALLQAEDLLIVDGPGALGLYRLELPAGADALATADRLRAAQGLVLSVDGPE